MRSQSPEPKIEGELEPGELDQEDEEGNKEDQQRMEIEEELKHAINQAKEKELDLDKVERARQRIRQNKLIKKDWVAQRQSDLEAQQQLNLNEQEDPKMAQGILMKDKGPKESLKKSRLKVLNPSILPDGASGIPACYGLTGPPGSPTQIGPPTWREPNHDALIVRLRERAGITKEGEEIMVIGSPTLTPTDTERPKLKVNGILEELTTTEIGTDTGKKNGTMTKLAYERGWYGPAEEDWDGPAEEGWYHEDNTYDGDGYGSAGIRDHRRYSSPYSVNNERRDEQLPRKHPRWNPSARSHYPASRWPGRL